MQFAYTKAAPYQTAGTAINDINDKRAFFALWYTGVIAATMVKSPSHRPAMAERRR